MSTYNESINELQQSIYSILNQTYSNLELIIVVDNPTNAPIITYLNSLTDSRIKIIKNNTNLGLVASLNKALKSASGNYVARMDADDISLPDRLLTQILHMKNESLDIVGGNLEFIDENGQTISYQNFPRKQWKINFFLRWGNCVPHPTWLIKKDVYISLNGYRNIPRCEDYDFICRALQNKFKIGNVNKYVLKYRIRKSSISNSNKGAQYLVRQYIANNRRNHLSEENIKNYISSDRFKKNLKKYDDFQLKKSLLHKKPDFSIIIKLLGNKYTYCLALEKIGLKIRNIS